MRRNGSSLGGVIVVLVSVALGWRPEGPVAALWFCLGGAALVSIGIGLGTDPNALSLHSFYRARLVRAYLGATNPGRIRDLLRQQEEVTRASREDDTPLHENRCWEAGGPLHLLNATLNLVGGAGMVPEQRPAELFTFSPLFCGSARTGYRPTALSSGGKMTLGTAMAISGAAASPSMGRRTFAPLAMLMTFLNVRLGYWIANPEQSTGDMPWTRFWVYYQLREFFTQTTALRRFCFLSDGDHLENLGLYPLIRRRCRYIIAMPALIPRAASTT